MVLYSWKLSGTKTKRLFFALHILQTRMHNSKWRRWCRQPRTRSRFHFHRILVAVRVCAHVGRPRPLGSHTAYTQTHVCTRTCTCQNVAPLRCTYVSAHMLCARACTMCTIFFVCPGIKHVTRSRQFPFFGTVIKRLPISDMLTFV